MKNKMTHPEFVKEHDQGKISIKIDKTQVGNFLASEFAKKEYRSAYKFWGYIAMLMTIGGFLSFFMINWIYALIILVSGIVIIFSNQRSSEQLVTKNMLEDEDFWNYILLHGGAEIIK